MTAIVQIIKKYGDLIRLINFAKDWWLFGVIFNYAQLPDNDFSSAASHGDEILVQPLGVFIKHSHTAVAGIASR